MPLTRVSKGERKVIRRVTADGEKIRLLQNLGIKEGESVQILTSGPGQVIIRIRHAGIALSRSLAERVIV